MNDTTRELIAMALNQEAVNDKKSEQILALRSTTASADIFHLHLVDARAQLTRCTSLLAMMRSALDAQQMAMKRVDPALATIAAGVAAGRVDIIEYDAVTIACIARAIYEAL